MTTFYGYKRLKTIDDWRGLAGDDKWVPTRSAYELACSWQGFGGLPKPIASAFDACGHEPLRSVSVDLCLVEKPVFLDTRIAPSMTDLMAYGRNAMGDPIVIAVEGKADEPFAAPIWAWVRGEGKDLAITAAPRPTRVRRLEFLAKHLATSIAPDSKLRYQLLHRTVSAVLEAQLHGAAAAIVVVHAFGPGPAENFSDFSDFLCELGGDVPTKGAVLGPFRLGEREDMPTYFLWWQQAVHNIEDLGKSRSGCPQTL